jgi:uncharacterized protein (DUF1697 family)
MKYVALLRGINVGGKHRLPMEDLAGILGDLGATDIETYIQSGNVVFAASRKVATGLAEATTARIAERFGFDAPVVVVSADDFATVVRNNPFVADGADPATLHVAFLADTPPASAVATLDAARSAPDAFVVRGAAIYLHLPNGVARTKLTNDWFDRKLVTRSTIRNWRTVLELARRLEP